MVRLGGECGVFHCRENLNYAIDAFVVVRK